LPSARVRFPGSCLRRRTINHFERFEVCMRLALPASGRARRTVMGMDLALDLELVDDQEKGEAPEVEDDPAGGDPRRHRDPEPSPYSRAGAYSLAGRIRFGGR
jgi:hypothetical protein